MSSYSHYDRFAKLESALESFGHLFERLEFKKRLTRQEQVFLDVYESINFTLNQGLHQFWGLEEPERIIESFRIIGEKEIADAISGTQFVSEIKVDSEGQLILTKEQERMLDAAEDIVFSGFESLHEKIGAFLSEHGLNREQGSAPNPLPDP